MWKKLLRNVLPPFITRCLRPERIYPPTYGLFGGYPSFEAAEAESAGYETEDYAGPIAESLRSLVVAAPYVVLDERFMQVHSAMSYIAHSENAGTMGVLDYGGGSGVYAKVIKQLMPGTAFDWTILESAPVVAACENIPDFPAAFVSSVEARAFDVAIISGALQYLKDPWSALEDTAKRARWIILTRLPVVEGDFDRVALQKAPPSLSMPLWLLSEDKLRRWIGDRLVLEWGIELDAGMCSQVNATAKGFLIRC